MAKPSRPCDPQNARAKYRTFFITTRTAQSKPILQTDRMAALFVEVLRCYMRAGKFRVHEFVVMPNHVHLLVTVGADMSIEKTMQLIKGNFSFRAGTELGFHGQIWQCGFSDVRIKDRRELSCSSTVHLQQSGQSRIGECSRGICACSLYLRKTKAQGLKPAIQTTGVGTTKVVP